MRKERTNSFRTEREAKERARVIEMAHSRIEVFARSDGRAQGRGW